MSENPDMGHPVGSFFFLETRATRPTERLSEWLPCSLAQLSFDGSCLYLWHDKVHGGSPVCVTIPGPTAGSQRKGELSSRAVRVLDVIGGEINFTV